MAGSTADRDDPGPRDGRSYVELAGGPLDGLLLDITDLCGTDHCEGVRGAHRDSATARAAAGVQRAGDGGATGGGRR
ncbi:hypothetical protein SHIRM173S_11275 [Streptomyces hirsutus]